MNRKKKVFLPLGPVCIAPEYQRMGYRKMLIQYSFDRATALGYDTIVIFGNPKNYVSLGFRGAGIQRLP